eukprot:TRINITY_DN6380_c0_g1_i1.p1 TRINITY_DN6380_c0_g1~~TRINITY_DN6380_c0_g1_i1.p1  ORF type:complete len:298 (+),score=42.67 TRINITY_DN6380_c0_g1_i1:94-987(+)
MHFRRLLLGIALVAAHDLEESLLDDEECTLSSGSCALHALQHRTVKTSETLRGLEPPAECLHHDSRYEPTNMRGQERSEEPDAFACSKRCAAVTDCAHFSFWPDGGCHLQDSSAKQVTKDKVVSGTPACESRGNSTSRGWKFDFNLTKTVSLGGLKDGVFDDVDHFAKSAWEKIKECFEATAQLRFAIWFHFDFDPPHCKAEAAVNSGSVKVRSSLCGALPVSATLMSGPAVEADVNAITFSECAHGHVICLDVRFVNKGGCGFNLWDVRTRVRSDNPVAVSTSWKTILWNIRLGGS